MGPGERRWWAPGNFGSRPHTTTAYASGGESGRRVLIRKRRLPTHTHTHTASPKSLFMLKRGGGEWGDGESSGKMGGNHCFYRKNISRFFSNMQDKRFFTPKNRTSSQTLINRAAALPPSAKRSDLKCQGLSTRIYTKGKDGAKYLSADSARSLP